MPEPPIPEDLRANPKDARAIGRCWRAKFWEEPAAEHQVATPLAAAAWFASFGFALPSFASSSGQATVELIAGAPILLAVTLAAAQLLAAGLCREQAASAAGAGASALLQDRDPLASARRAVPGWSRGRLTVKRRGRVLTVSIKPPTLVPGLSSLLSVTAHADAGPAA